MIGVEVDTDDMNQQSQMPRRFVDRQIPVGVLIVLLLNLGAGVWFASAYAATIRQNTDRITATELHDKSTDSDIVDIKTSLAVLKDRSKDNQETSHRIEDLLRSNNRR